MSRLVEMGTNSNVHGFPVAATFVAVICHEVRVCPGAIGECRDDFFQVSRIRLQAMRPENGKFDSVISAT